VLDPLECRDNYSATSNDMKLVHWPLMDGLLHLVHRWGNWVGQQPAQAAPRVTNVTVHPITASVPSPYCCIMVRCFVVLMCP